MTRTRHAMIERRERGTVSPTHPGSSPRRRRERPCVLACTAWRGKPTRTAWPSKKSSWTISASFLHGLDRPGRLGRDRRCGVAVGRQGGTSRSGTDHLPEQYAASGFRPRHVAGPSPAHRGCGRGGGPPSSVSNDRIARHADRHDRIVLRAAPGRITNETTPFLAGLLRRLKTRECKAPIFGCTELPLVTPDPQRRYPYWIPPSHLWRPLCGAPWMCEPAGSPIASAPPSPAKSSGHALN